MSEVQNAQVMRPDWSVGCLKCQRLAAQALLESVDAVPTRDDIDAVLRCALEIKDRQGRPS